MSESRNNQTDKNKFSATSNAGVGIGSGGSGDKTIVAAQAAIMAILLWLGKFAISLVILFVLLEIYKRR